MKNLLSLLFLVSSFTVTGSLAFADDHASHHAAKKGMDMADMSPEMRKQMAAEHQKMADCLNSTKPMSECKKEMMEECPMMKGHMDGKGKACAHGMMCSEDKGE